MRIAGHTVVRQKIVGCHWFESLESCYDNTSNLAAKLQVWRGTDTFFPRDIPTAKSMISACQRTLRDIDEFNENEVAKKNSSVEEMFDTTMMQAMMRADAEENLDGASKTLVSFDVFLECFLSEW